MKKSIYFMITLLSVCMAGCSRPEEGDNQSVPDYSEEYEVSPYGSEEELNSLTELKITLDTQKEWNLSRLPFQIENTSGKEYRYATGYFEIEAEQSGVWYQLKQLDDPAKNETDDPMIKPGEHLALDVDVKHYYGELPAGHYRLIKQFAYFEHEKDWDYDTFHLSCEFTIP